MISCGIYVQYFYNVVCCIVYRFNFNSISSFTPFRSLHLSVAVVFFSFSASNLDSKRPFIKPVSTYVSYVVSAYFIVCPSPIPNRHATKGCFLATEEQPDHITSSVELSILNRRASIASAEPQRYRLLPLLF